MRKYICFILLLFLWICGFSQHTEEKTFFIRTYNSSLAVYENQQGTGSIQLSPDGAMEQIQENDFGTAYLYQAQEFDANLGIYFFPARIYSVKGKHFLQPDPLSQYHSPYVFLGGDFVNYIDQDGREGKPLVLYQEDFRHENNLSPSMTDLMEDIPNAHYVPMSDFLNERVGPLPEWNGNVFIKSHSLPVKGQEIVAEELPKGRAAKTKRAMTAQRELQSDHDFITVDGKEFGNKLRVLADREQVQVKSIMSGSCEGSRGAERVAKGFTEKKVFGKSAKRPLRVGGLKPENYSFFGGKRETTEPGLKGFRSSRFYISDNYQGRFNTLIRQKANGKSYLEDFKRSGASAREAPLPYGSTSDIERMYNGELPGALERNFKITEWTY